MKVVFIGTRNDFDIMLVDWLARRTEVTGVVWTTSGMWRKSWKGKFNVFSKRAKKYGYLKALDEALFFLIYKKYLSKGDYDNVWKKIVDPYFKKYEDVLAPEKQIFSDNVNDQKTIDFVKDCNPDVIFAMCTNDFFGKKLRSIPKKGVYLWHEGITPEYKGLYSPFWAFYNSDFKNVGYSLIKMNNELDGGEIYIQGEADYSPEDIKTFSYVGHKAIYDSLDEVEKFLKQLEQDDIKEISRINATKGYFTYPGASHLIKFLLGLNNKKKNFKGSVKNLVKP